MSAGAPGALALVARDDVPGRVDPGLQARLPAPADKRGGGRLVRIRQEEARQTPRLVGEGGESVEPLHQPRAGGEIGLAEASGHLASAV